MNKTVKAVVFWLVIVISAIVSWQVVKSGGKQEKIPEISYSQFLSEAEAGDIAKVSISNREVSGWRNDRGTFRVIAPSNQTAMVDTLRQNHVEIWFRDTPSGDWPTWLMNLTPLILLFVLWYIMLRPLIRKSRARTEPNAPIEPTGAFGGR